MMRLPPGSTLFPYTTSSDLIHWQSFKISSGRVEKTSASAPSQSILIRSTCVIRITQVDLIKIEDRKSTRLNSSHVKISYAVFCLKKNKNKHLLSYDKLLNAT